MNLPLPAGATGDVLQEAMETTVAPAVESFGPTWVLVSAGFDGHRADPLADLDLSAGDFADLASVVRGVRSRRTGGSCCSSRAATTSTRCASRSAPPPPPSSASAYRPEGATAGGPGLDALAFLRRRRDEVLEASG